MRSGFSCLLQLFWRQGLIGDDGHGISSQLHMHCSGVFTRLIAGLSFGDRELNVAALSELAELDAAQAREMKEELSTVFSLDETVLTLSIEANYDATHFYTSRFRYKLTDIRLPIASVSPAFQHPSG